MKNIVGIFHFRPAITFSNPGAYSRNNQNVNNKLPAVISTVEVYTKNFMISVVGLKIRKCIFKM